MNDKNDRGFLHLMDYARVESGSQVKSPGYWSVCGLQMSGASSLIHTGKSTTSSQRRLRPLEDPQPMCPLCLEAIAVLTGRYMIDVTPELFKQFKEFVLEKYQLDENYKGI